MTLAHTDFVPVGERERETELERKWMRFKPLISTWSRDGQAYETVALKHSTYIHKIRGSSRKLFVLLPNCILRQSYIKLLLNYNGIDYLSRKQMVRHPLPNRCMYVTRSVSYSINLPYATTSSLRLEIRSFALDGGNP